MKTFRLALSAVALAAALPAHAQTEIQWWHSMTGGLNDWVVDLANGFNASQKDYKIVPTYKGSYDESMTAAIAAFRAGNAPHILQVFEVGTATMMAAKGAVVLAERLIGKGYDLRLYDRNVAIARLTGALPNLFTEADARAVTEQVIGLWRKDHGRGSAASSGRRTAPRPSRGRAAHKRPGPAMAAPD